MSKTKSVLSRLKSITESKRLLESKPTTSVDKSTGWTYSSKIPHLTWDPTLSNDKIKIKDSDSDGVYIIKLGENNLQVSWSSNKDNGEYDVKDVSNLDEAVKFIKSNSSNFIDIPANIKKLL